MKTYHQYQSESKQAEQKLSVIQQQLAKIKSAKKQKAMDKRVKKVRTSSSHLAPIWFEPKRKPSRDKWNTRKQRWKPSKLEMIIWWRSRASTRLCTPTVPMMCRIWSIAWTLDFTRPSPRRFKCISQHRKTSNEVDRRTSSSFLWVFLLSPSFQNDRHVQSSDRRFGYRGGQAEVFGLLQCHLHHSSSNQIWTAQRRWSLASERSSSDSRRNAVAIRSNANAFSRVKNGKWWGEWRCQQMCRWRWT